MERSRYNGVTYKETYGYDGFEEYLEKVTAYFGTTQKAQNQMYYWEGELSDVTDGKVRYHFNVDKGGYSDTVTWKVYDESWKTLEEIETEHEGNDVTQTYYRNDSSTPTDTFVYTTDKYGKPTAISYNGEQKVTYNYTEGSESEAVWLLASVVDNFCGRAYTYSYNPDGTLCVENVNRVNVVDATTGEIELVEEFKAERLNESSKKYTIGTDTITHSVVQKVENDARLTQVVNVLGKTDDAENVTVVPAFNRYYTYDSFGRMQIKQVAQLANSEEENGEVISQTTYGYSNGHMLPTSETYQRGGGVTYGVTYDYDTRGNLQSVCQNNYNRTTYTYDALNRLTKETINGTVKSYTYNDEDKGRMSSFNGTAMDYDDRGRLETFGDIRFEYDNYGNRTKKKNKNTDEILCSYEWTRGRLLASVGGTTFEYDAKGRRTKKGSTKYYYDGDRLIAEVRSDGTLYFFYDESGVCGMRYNNTNYEFIRNIFGDVVAICNEAGGRVAFYSYDAWGNCTVEINQNNIANINPFRYRGYYYDIESGLYYLMSRYYDPEIGQFISPDTQDYLAPEIIGGVDLYAYGLNNPVMFVDPTGHFVLSAWMVGALVGFGVSFVSSLVSQALAGESLADGQVWAIAAIDGAFGAVSGMLATVPGIGSLASGCIDAVSTFANSWLTTGISNNWQFNASDWASIATSSIVSGLFGVATSLGKVGITDTKAFKQASGDIDIAKGKIKARKDGLKVKTKNINYYSRKANKSILKAYTTFEAGISYIIMFAQSVAGGGLPMLYEGLLG